VRAGVAVEVAVAVALAETRVTVVEELIPLIPLPLPEEDGVVGV
jgi:hypothetical protein